MSVEKAAAPPFPSQALVPHPFRLSAAAAGSGGAHSLRTRRARRKGGRRRRWAEGRRRWRGGGGLGRLATQGKLGTSISNGKRPSRSAADAHGPGSVPSSPARKRCPIPGLGRCGRCRPLRRPHPSSFARLHRGIHPSLPCEWRRATTRIRPLGLLAAGSAGGAHGGGGDPRLSPLPELDPLGATAQARQGGTPEHVRGAGGPAAVVLRVYDLRRGGRLQSQRRRRRWRRMATRGVRVAAFAGSQLAPHACCGGPWSTFAVASRGGLPPYPPIRVAPSAMPRSPARPGHPFPSNLTPPVRHQQQAANTHQVIDETHVRYI